MNETRKLLVGAVSTILILMCICIWQIISFFNTTTIVSETSRQSSTYNALVMFDNGSPDVINIVDIMDSPVQLALKLWPFLGLALLICVLLAPLSWVLIRELYQQEIDIAESNVTSLEQRHTKRERKIQDEANRKIEAARQEMYELAIDQLNAEITKLNRKIVENQNLEKQYREGIQQYHLAEQHLLYESEQFEIQLAESHRARDNAQKSAERFRFQAKRLKEKLAELER